MPLTNLTALEEMHNHADENNIVVRTSYYESPHKGYCFLLFDGAVVTLNSFYIQSSADELCILAEEIGHVETGTVLPIGEYICPQYKRWVKRKNEILALRCAIQRLLPPSKIQAAISKGNRGAHGIAKFCGVTEEFAESALRYYERKQITFCWRA